MQLHEGIAWLRPHLDRLGEAYGDTRFNLDPIPAFEQALAHVLDEARYERLQSFFDGDQDTTYGQGEGERARTALREALEAARTPADTPTTSRVNDEASRIPPENGRHFATQDDSSAVGTRELEVTPAGGAARRHAGLLWLLAVGMVLAAAGLTALGLSNLRDVPKIENDTHRAAAQERIEAAATRAVGKRISTLEKAASGIPSADSAHAPTEDLVLNNENAVVSAGNAAVASANNGDLSGAQAAFSGAVTSALNTASQSFASAQQTLAQFRAELQQLDVLLAAK
jgi:hypothetical protein